MHVSVKIEICILMDARQSAAKPHAAVHDRKEATGTLRRGFCRASTR
jgi:hypothetical protein